MKIILLSKIIEYERSMMDESTNSANPSRTTSHNNVKMTLKLIGND